MGTNQRSHPRPNVTRDMYFIYVKLLAYRFVVPDDKNWGICVRGWATIAAGSDSDRPAVVALSGCCSVLKSRQLLQEGILLFCCDNHGQKLSGAGWGRWL